MKSRQPHRLRTSFRRPSLGLTLIELMLVVAALGVLLVLAMSVYPNYRERMLVDQAKGEIAIIAMHVKNFQLDEGGYPVALSDIGQAIPDPWGNPYRYTDLTGPGNGAARKDRKLNPLNSDFDLFSMGRNGTYKPQISNQESLDDVIRASDGGFIDLASKY